MDLFCRHQLGRLFDTQQPPARIDKMVKNTLCCACEACVTITAERPLRRGRLLL